MNRRVAEQKSGRRSHSLGRLASVLTEDAARRRLEFLAEASHLLCSSLDYEITLASIARLAVPEIADWCVVDMLEGGHIRRLAVAHVDPDKIDFAREFENRYPVDADAPSGVPNVLRTGSAELYPEIPDEMLVNTAKSEAHLRDLRGLGMNSVMIVPLVARERTLGAITFIAAESGVSYSEVDLAFAEDLARRAALAVDNARLYKEAQEAARRKDESVALLEAILRQMPAGVAIAEPSGRLILGNDAVSQIMGTGPERDEARSIKEYDRFQHRFPDIPVERWPLVRAIKNGEIVQGENMPFIRGNGSRGVIRASAAPVLNREGDVVAAVTTFYDITERIQAEQALRESNSRVIDILESISDSFVAFDAQLRFRYVNAAAEKLLEHDRESLLSKTVYEVFPGFAGSVFDKQYQRVLRDKVKIDFEAFYEPFGMWIEVHAYPTSDGITLYFRDVTEQHRSHQELRASFERFRIAQQAANMSNWDWNISSGEITWSENAAAVYGLKQGGFIPDFQTWMQFIVPEDRERIKQQLQQAFEKRSEYDAEFRIRRPDGQIRWLTARGKVCFDEEGYPVRMLGVDIDITARKQAQEALRVSEETHRTLFETMNQGVVFQDMNGTVVSMNPAAERIFGVSMAEARGPDFGGFYRRAIREDGTPLREMEHPSLIALQSGRKVKGSVFGVFNTKEGQYRWIKADAFPQFQQDENRPWGVYTIIDDMTERRRTEEVIRVSEKLAAAGRLAASIAHEINNPLESVTNLLYLLEYEPSLSTVARQYAALAQQELARVTHIARQTLAFYRDSSSPVPVKVSALLENVLDLYRRKIEAKQVTIVKEYDVEYEIMAFPGELRQVFSNLVVNAVDSVPQNGRVRLHVYASRDWLHRDRRGLHVIVADNGPGIPQSHRSKVFEPFFTTKGDKGTGLGLWVSQGIIQKHGGSIRFRSSTSKEHGTVFSVFLPFKVALHAQKHVA